MPPSDFYFPTEPELLHMENELLHQEVLFLRAREAERQRQIGEPEPAVRASADEEVISRDELRRLRRAESDIRWFVDRLGGSHLGWLFRRWPGFRVLEQRYAGPKTRE